MKPTLKLLLNRIESWCDDHAIITEFGHGLLPDLEKGNKRSEWVMVYLVIQNPTIFDYGVDFSFDFIVLAPTEVNPDSKDADMESLKQVQSDLLQIIQDFLAEVKNGTSYFYKDGSQIFDIADQPVRALPFVEEFDQVLTGWNAPITIQVNDPLNQCDIPYIGAFDPPTTGPCECDPATILEPSTNGYGIELAGVQVGDPFGTPTTELASGFSGILGTQITISIKGSSGAEITDGQRAYILGLNQSGVFDLTVGDIRINNSEGTSIAVAGIDGATLSPVLDMAGDETGVYQVLYIPSVSINDSRMISSDYVEAGGFPVGGYHEDILATAQELHPDVVVEDSGANSESFPWRGPGSYVVSNTEQKHTDGTSFSTPRTGPALADKNLPTIIITDSTDGDAELYNGGSQGGTYDGVAESLTFSVTPAGVSAPALTKSVSLFETNAHLRGTGASFFSPGASDAFSICMFFKPLEDLSGNKHYAFITNRYTAIGSPGFQLRYENLTDILTFVMMDSSGNRNRTSHNASGGIALNLWNSLVFTKSGLDASTYNVYLNKTLLGKTVIENNLTGASNTTSAAELSVNAFQTSSGVLNTGFADEMVSYAQILLVDKALSQTEVNEYHDDSGVDMSFAADILHSFASDDTDMVHPTLTDSITGTETLTIINGPNALDNNDEP